MKDIKRPRLFEDFGEELMSNFDHSIDREVEEAIKGKPCSCFLCSPEKYSRKGRGGKTSFSGEID